MKKFAFKIGQEVVFCPEDGKVLVGKIRTTHVFRRDYKKGGVDGGLLLGYTVAEPDGTLWNCAEDELSELVEKAKLFPVKVLTEEEKGALREKADSEKTSARFLYEVPTRLYTVVNRAGCETVADLILFAQKAIAQKMKVRNLGQKTACDLYNWLDANYPGWRQL